jgi:hypothetical protein
MVELGMASAIELERKRQAATLTMARYLARKRLIAELIANGLRPTTIEPATFLRAISAMLEACRPELIAEAKAILQD